MEDNNDSSFKTENQGFISSACGDEEWKQEYNRS